MTPTIYGRVSRDEARNFPGDVGFGHYSVEVGVGMRVRLPEVEALGAEVYVRVGRDQNVFSDHSGGSFVENTARVTVGFRVPY